MGELTRLLKERSRQSTSGADAALGAQGVDAFSRYERLPTSPVLMQEFEALSAKSLFIEAARSLWRKLWCLETAVVLALDTDTDFTLNLTKHE